MSKKYRAISLRRLRRYSLSKRKSKVGVSGLAKSYQGGGSFKDFIDSLPGILAARDFREVVHAITEAVHRGRPVVLGMGAHPIKVGLSPVIIDLMQKGVIGAVATNGASVVHDFEIAYMGRTSEDVASELRDGSFGMAMETGRMINRAINKASERDAGLGEAVGEMILKGRAFPYKDLSILSEACRLSIPVTVHVAIGTDIIHMHPECSGEATGRASYRDFRIFASVVSDLQGGVFINLGSAVLIPEVFLKALTIARNLGNRVNDITTVTMDFTRHYRPMVNVVHRPTLSGGKGYYLTGHHEVMFPLLAAAVKDSLGF